ncbi:MAG: 8-amino-7-oxononanoate synthase [Gammaproteobacteria bacterium]|nr:8-amino-7-oxononanoate synthase [Gammaproteobacteria bacterium]
MKDLQKELDQRRAAHLYRSRRISDGPQQAEMIIDGKAVINFCSNDYLGLANHQAVKTALINGVKAYGAGSGAAHLVNGHSTAHHALEQELAEFTGYPRALLFSTGYMANLGLAQALIGKGDTVLEDRLNHASLIDGGLLSGARFQRYAHNDVVQLEQKLIDAKGETLVLSDGVFSMDGDVANIPALASACKQNEAWLMIDDAHGFGVLGENGRGSLEHFQLTQNDVPIYMATLGKALGTSGAFIAGSEALIETLIQKARPYIYTTATPPAIAEATRASLKVIQQEDLRGKLNDNIAYFRNCATQAGIALTESFTAIQPIILGDEKRAVEISEQLLNNGLLVTAIRPPTVPKGTARLRITLSAIHSKQHIDRLINALGQILQEKQTP